VLLFIPSNRCYRLVSLSRKTRLGTRFPYGIVGYTWVKWYEYWTPIVPWYELDANEARVCTNKAQIYLVKKGLLRFEHDLQTIFSRLFNGSNFGLVRYCTVKHDFNSIYSTLTGFTYGLDDLCKSIARIYTIVYV